MERRGVRVVWTRPDPAMTRDPFLDATERARCRRLADSDEQARHATGRVLAKREGARLLNVAPARVSVVPDVSPTAGRPRLFLDGRPAALHLSIAHAGSAVVVALGNAPCGVDVEEVAAMAEVLDASTAFSRAERDRLAATPARERLALAARWWTGKEAALKAVGVGLAVEAAAVAADGRSTRVVALGRVFRVRLEVLDAPAGYSATLARVASSRSARRAQAREWLSRVRGFAAPGGRSGRSPRTG